MYFSGRYLLVCFAHFLFVVVALRSISYLAPDFIKIGITSFLNFAACLVIARCTFEFTKNKLLNGKISNKNKAVLITGCDTGFGNELAKRLDRKGFHVFATCLFPSGPGAEDLRNHCSKRLQVVELNVAKDESVQEAFQFVKNNLGASELWAVVNNAGIQKGFSADTARFQDFKDTMEVNGFGMVRVTKAFLPLLKLSRGRLVNLTSINARISISHNTPYIMSKYAAAGFNDCLRHEMEDWGIRVITVEPELFQTMIVDQDELGRRFDAEASSLDPEHREEYGEKYFTNLKISAQRMIKYYGSSKIYKVVDALEAAVSSRHPNIVYRPYRGIYAKLFFTFYEAVPINVQDVVQGVLKNFLSYPKPAKA